MPGPRAAVPLQSSDLAGAARRGLVVTDPAGKPYVTAFLEDAGGQVIGADGQLAGPFGDVYGDAAGISENLPEFDGDGYHLVDSGYSVADLLALIGGAGTGDVIGPASAVDDRIATFDGTTGKLIQDGGSTIAGVLASALAAAKALFPGVLTTNLLADGATAFYAAVTAKAILYANASGVLTADTAMLAWDYTNLRLGINRASPGYPLEVRGTPVDIGYLITARPTSTGSAYISMLANGATNSAGFSFQQLSNAYEWRMAVVGNDGNALRFAAGSGGATIMLYMTQALNLILGGSAADPGTGSFCFVLKNGTAAATPAADSSLLHAGDVSSSSQLFAMNEAGQKVQVTAPLDAITCIFDGGGSVLAAKTVYVQVPYDCKVTGWRIVADQAGSAVVDVWKDSYANYPPTVADTIAGSEKPTLSAAAKAEDTNLTTWTDTTIDAGEYLAFALEASPATVTWLCVQLLIRKGT